MSEEAQNNNQMIVYALVAIAVLLAVLVGVLIFQKTTAVPGPTATGAATQPPTANSSTAAPTQMPPGSTAPAGPFDPKTATKVPTGMTPEQALKAYNEYIIGGKFADAYKLLPKDKQASYGSPEAYASQVKAYGITSYKTGTPTTSGNDVTIVSEQVTPQMPISYTWVFTKDGSTWYVKSRTMGGTIQ
jgi:hypothetical protein